MKLKFVLIFCSVLFLASCGAKKNVVNKKHTGTVIVEPKPVELPSVNQKELTKKLVKKNPDLNKLKIAYIRKYAPIAVKEMHLYNIPASITLAQGILESASGRSVLARKSNNHFGIKCHTGWRGERVYHDDDEKGECFRKYQYVETSYKDHSLFLTQRKRYAFLFSYGTKNYKKWARGLKKAGYATDRRYPDKLIKIIEDYKLYEFDDVSKRDFKIAYKKEKRQQSDSKRVEKYFVKKGDTLYSISKKFGLSVDKLKKINRLKDNIISIGQLLIIE